MHLCFCADQLLAVHVLSSDFSSGHVPDEVKIEIHVNTAHTFRTSPYSGDCLRA